MPPLPPEPSAEQPAKARAGAGRWRRDLLVLLLLSLPFALAAGVLLLLAEGSGGWQGLGHAIHAIGAAAAWALAVALYLGWILWRDGLSGAGIPAAVLLAILTCAGAVWEASDYDATARCHAARDFIDRLAALPPAARPAAIAGAGALLRDSPPCLTDALLLRFGRDPLPPEGAAPPGAGERREVLAALLAAGLPADDRMLYIFAVLEADPVATSLLLQQRAAGGPAPPVPGHVLDTLLRQADPCGAGDTAPEAADRRAVLSLLLAAAPPDAAGLEAETRRQLACLRAGGEGEREWP